MEKGQNRSHKTQDYKFLTRNVGDLGIIFKGKGILKSEVIETGLPCIRYGELYTKYNFNFKSTYSFCSEQTAKQSQEIFKGDILFAGSGETVEEIGKCAAYLGNEVAYAGGDIIILRPEKDDSVFLSYLLNSVDVVKQKSILGQGNSVVHIYPKDIAYLIIKLPPVAEQRKIARIINAWDEYIETLETLIQKKERCKKALMQQLLTGKKRFKEFKGAKWKVVDLAKAAWFQEGPGLRKWQFTDKGIKVINITNIVGGFLDLSLTNRHISMEEFNKMYKHFAVDENDIVVASSGNSYCKHGVVRRQDLPLVMNTSVIRFKPLENTDWNYLNQFLKSTLFKDRIDILITGGAQPNFGPAHLKEVEIPLPSIKEQKQIASVLSSADEEIESLRAKLEHCKLQKKGLMQILLTGKKRVKIN